MRRLLRDPVFWAALLFALAALLYWRYAVGAESCWRGWVVQVLDVVDGDTVDLEVTWYPRLSLIDRVRLVGIDTPELHGSTRSAGLAAKAFTAAWLQDMGAAELVVCTPSRDSFGRLLARVVSGTKGDLAASLLAAGHAVPYRP